MSSLVDYHVHLDLFQDHRSMLERCDKQKIEVFTMTTTPLAWKKNCELAVEFPRVRVGLGLHPQLVAERAHEVELFEKLVSQTDFVGEVGLDAGPRFYKSLDLQREVFLRILKASNRSGPKILSIHSVRTASKVLDCIEAICGAPRNLGFVFHWFTGSKSEMQRAVEMGCFFSINPMMLRSESSRKILCSIPLNRLLTETDGPFTEKSPGCRFLPEDLVGTVRNLGVLLGKTDEVMQNQLYENVGRIEVLLGKRNSD